MGLRLIVLAYLVQTWDMLTYVQRLDVSGAGEAWMPRSLNEEKPHASTRMLGANKLLSSKPKVLDAAFASPELCLHNPLA